jgi:4,5:9,10-diseco-3-hydroxy-5,9,17-trioxoandrosta-1(10),2-diene-4-oate hydrolase
VIDVATEPEGLFADAAGVRIHYHDVGSGPAVIALHGGGPGATAWSAFRSNLNELAAEYRMLLVDLPQFGRSDKIHLNGPRLTMTARILLALMDGLGLDRPHFIGNSIGGQVAVRLAIDHPDRVGRLVLIGSTPIQYSVFVPQPLEGIKLLRSYYEGEGPTREKMRYLLETLVFDRKAVTDEMVEERFRASAGEDLVRLHAGGPPFEHESLLADLQRVKAPSLLVWGQDDRFGALDIGLLMVRAFADARMLIFGRCGHWAQVEHAAEFNQAVLGFLTET